MKPLALSAVALALAGVATAAASPLQARADYTAFAEKYPDLAVSLTSDDFRVPAEREMIATLMNKNPDIRDLAQGVRDEQLRKVEETRQLYLAHAVAAGPDQYPRVHAATEAARASLQLDQPVTVFVTNNAEMREDVMGVPKHGHIGNSFGPSIVLLTSGMVKAMSPAELQFVIAREVGHVKANHRFYTNLAFAWQQAKDLLPMLFPDESHDAAEGVGGSMALFFDRGPAARRLSEFSADRAGALACSDPRQALASLAKLARGDIENEEGFDLDAYLEQVETALADLSPKDARTLTSKQGFTPFMLTRVGELNRFIQSEEYARLKAGAEADPFRLELENLARIGTSARHYQERQDQVLKDPKTARLDPLVRRQLLADLEREVTRRQDAVTELTALMADQLDLPGYGGANALFEDLAGYLERTGDARPALALLKVVGQRIDLASQAPDLSAEEKAEMEAKKARLTPLAELAPEEEPFPVEAGEPLPWMEHVDLPRILDDTIDQLEEAAQEGKGSFLARLDDLRPQFWTTGLKIFKALSVEEKRYIAELLSAHNGQLADAAGKLLAAGEDEARLKSIFDDYYGVARKYLRFVPMFVIRSRLARIAKFDV